MNSVTEALRAAHEQLVTLDGLYVKDVHVPNDEEPYLIRVTETVNKIEQALAVSERSLSERIEVEFNQAVDVKAQMQFRAGQIHLAEETAKMDNLEEWTAAKNRRIELTRGHAAIVDEEDHEHLVAWKWRAAIASNGKAYAKRSVNITGADGKSRVIVVEMARQILGLPQGDSRVPDHRDGDGLNNRRSNLRIATRRENNINIQRRTDNASGVTGVCWDKKSSKWRAYISAEDGLKALGFFENIEDAIHVRRQAEKDHYGEWTRVPAQSLGTLDPDIRRAIVLNALTDDEAYHEARNVYQEARDRYRLALLEIERLKLIVEARKAGDR